MASFCISRPPSFTGLNIASPIAVFGEEPPPMPEVKKKIPRIGLPLLSQPTVACTWSTSGWFGQARRLEYGKQLRSLAL
jgi:hypothetical protein